MSDRSVSDYDMPNRTWPHRTDVSGIPDTVFSALLEGGTPEAEAPASLQHVADVLAALRAEPAADETAGQAAAVAEFRRRARVSSRSSRSRRAKPAVLFPMLRTRAGTAATAAVVGLGGFAAAAYAGALPAAAQQVAHDTIGAPQPGPHGSPATDHHGTPVGPNASGRARYGLCTAFAHGKEHGKAAEKSVAFRNLEKAAGGAANVASYCAGVPHPGASHSKAAGHPAGQPEASAKPRPTGRPPHP